MTATAEAAEAYTAVLTEDELSLVAQLKAKYANGGAAVAAEKVTTAPAAEEAMQTDPRPAVSLPPFRPCIICGGSGSVNQHYDCRSIHSPCTSCDGSGSASRSSSQQQEPSTVATPRQQGHRRGATAVAKYERELEELRESLVACTDKRERELRQELARQLEHHLDRLRQRHQQA